MNLFKPPQPPPAPDLHPVFGTTMSRWFFGACILWMLYLGYQLIAPYLVPIFLAVVLVVVAGPLYQSLLEFLGGREAMASGITCLLLLVIIVVPFLFVTSIIATQALSLYATLNEEFKADQLAHTIRDNLGHLGPAMDNLHDILGVTRADILQGTGDLLRKVSNFLYANLANLLAGVTNLVIGFALMLFVTFYLLKDGTALLDRVLDLSPLPPELNHRVRSDMTRSIQSTIRGTVVLAILQGIAGGLGFYIFGVPKALFWGTVMIFASVVPLVGTALVWLPAGIYLMVLGTWGQAVGVMFWCGAAGMLGDNVLRPRLIGGASLHPLLTFFSVLGGLSLFGMVGLILGPLVLAVLLSLLEVYQRYFLDKPAVVCHVDEESPPEQGAQDREPVE